MGHILKPIIVFLAALSLISLMMTSVNQTKNDWTNNELSYALRVATQDATQVVMDDNYIFDGDEEPIDFRIDLNKAAKQFKSSFYANIGSTVSPDSVNSMNITMYGYAGYRYVYGLFGSGTETIPFGYTYADGTTMYEFTLGDRVYVTDTSTGTETVLTLSTLPENYFSSTLNNINFRNFAVMNGINSFLNTFYGEKANTTAYNADTGVYFDLAAIDYAQDDATTITRISSIIDGPSFFAIVDINDAMIDRMVRVMSIGAAELKLNV